MTEILLETLRSEWEAAVRLTPRAVIALLVLAVSVAVGRLVSAGAYRIIQRSKLNRIHRQFFRRTVLWAVVLLGFATALSVMGMRTAAAGLLAGGGITAVILGFAFREIGENFLAGFFLAFSRPFEVDDIIQSGDLKGRVRNIELRYTHIRTADGRDIYLPNARLFNSPVVNFTRDGLLRPSFRIGIDYGNDAKRACEILKGATGDIAGVAPTPAPVVTIASFEPTFVQLEVGFWVDTFQEGVDLSQVGSDVMEACRRALREGGFTVSSEVTTALTFAASGPVDVRVESH